MHNYSNKVAGNLPVALMVRTSNFLLFVKFNPNYNPESICRKFMRTIKAAYKLLHDYQFNT